MSVAGSCVVVKVSSMGRGYQIKTPSAISNPPEKIYSRPSHPKIVKFLSIFQKTPRASAFPAPAQDEKSLCNKNCYPIKGEMRQSHLSRRLSYAVANLVRVRGNS